MPSTQLQEWKNSGKYISYSAHSHQIFVKEIGDQTASANDTLLLLHGFPESSYSYHRVIDGLSNVFKRIVLFDMIGYGWSDKPEDSYSYSLLEQADTALKVWEQFGVTGGHLLSHDMGDSVATELAFRYVQGLLPSWFSDSFQSFTFTNGSMVLELAELRVMQKVLLSKHGKRLRNLTTYRIFKHQVRSAHGNTNLSDDEIESLWLSNTVNDGHLKSYLTIQYLNDRKKFEKTRWLPALSQLKLPIHLCWGDEDQVARVEMAHHLQKHVCKDANLSIMNGLGHFCQLGSPDVWLEYVTSFYNQLRS